MFGSKFFSARYWQARLFTRSTEAVEPETAPPPGSGTRMARGGTPAVLLIRAQIDKRNNETLALLLTM